MNKYKWFSAVVVCALLAGLLPFGWNSSPAYAQTRTFPETGKTVGGRFLEYWNQNGGLPQQGYPISAEMQEVSDDDGKTYTVQYFERAVFEKHPEKARPYDVLLSLLGVFYYNEKYGGNAPGQKVNTTNPRRFTETGHTIGGAFRKYWEQHGGLAQQGYPISDEFQEIDKDGATRTVQYFQRAVFEYHQEFAGTANEVLLSLLGVFFYERKHGGQPPIPSVGSPVTAPGWTHVVAMAGDVVLFYNASNGHAITARLNTDGTYTLLKEHSNLGSYWTHIVAGPSGLVLFYGADDGALEVGRINSDGTFQRLQGYGHSRAATHLVVDSTGKVFTYDSVSGSARFGLLKSNGEYEDKNAYFMDKNYTHVVSTGFGVTLMYMQQTGHAVTYKFDENGVRTVLEAYADGAFCTCWTHIISNGQGRVLFYDVNTGQGATGPLIITGLFVQRQSYPAGSFSTNWTQITVAPNGVWLFYNGTTGRMGTGILDEQFAYRELKAYQPGE